MPLYSFVNENKEIEEHFLKYTELEQFIKDNPQLKQKLAAPPQGDSVRLGVRRIDDNFNDVLKKAKSAHWKSTIETR